MESTTETIAVERQIAIDASPETVWQFLVDPAKATRWMGMSASLDARPGGEYRVDVIPGKTAWGAWSGGAPRRRGLVRGGGGRRPAEAPTRAPPASSTIEIELIPNGDGT